MMSPSLEVLERAADGREALGAGSISPRRQPPARISSSRTAAAERPRSGWRATYRSRGRTVAEPLFDQRLHAASAARSQSTSRRACRPRPLLRAQRWTVICATKAKAARPNQKRRVRGRSGRRRAMTSGTPASAKLAHPLRLHGLLQVVCEEGDPDDVRASQRCRNVGDAVCCTCASPSLGTTELLVVHPHSQHQSHSAGISCTSMDGSRGRRCPR